MTDKPWKAFERKVAKKLGSKRVGPMGTDTNDVEHASLAIECKYRKTIPKLIKDGLNQADKKDGRTPTLFIKEAGSPKDVVCMWAKDFWKLLGAKRG